jgi:hypothetical protein
VALRPPGPLRLVPVWAALAGTFTLTVTVLGVVVWTGLDLLGVKNADVDDPERTQDLQSGNAGAFQSGRGF